MLLRAFPLLGPEGTWQRPCRLVLEPRPDRGGLQASSRAGGLQSNKSSFSQGSARSTRNQGTISDLTKYISGTHAVYVCVLVRGRPASASAAAVGQLHRHTCWTSPECHDRPRPCPGLVARSGWLETPTPRSWGGGVIQAAQRADILDSEMIWSLVLGVQVCSCDPWLEIRHRALDFCSSSLRRKEQPVGRWLILKLELFGSWSGYLCLWVRIFHSRFLFNSGELILGRLGLARRLVEVEKTLPSLNDLPAALSLTLQFLFFYSLFFHVQSSPTHAITLSLFYSRKPAVLFCEVFLQILLLRFAILVCFYFKLFPLAVLWF